MNTMSKELADLIFPNAKDVSYYEEKYPKRDLPEGAIVARYAPSPTGFNHIGGVMQAMISQTIAKQTGGKKKESNLIGLILDGHETMLEYYPTFITSALKQASLYGKHLVIYYGIKEDELISTLNKSSSPIDGAIVDIPIKSDRIILWKTKSCK